MRSETGKVGVGGEGGGESKRKKTIMHNVDLKCSRNAQTQIQLLTAAVRARSSFNSFVILS